MAVWLLWPAAPREPVRVVAAAGVPAVAAETSAVAAGHGPPAPSAAVTASAATPKEPVAVASSDDLADHVPPGQTPSMKQVIEGLHARGIRTGLGAFNPPGTRPPLIGLAVPEDFALPPGYVRHHQATDDGQRIEAILMFAPDFRLFDAQGREIPLPADRVVPPELAPPGLPLRRITLPPPRQGE
ncbi:hypothetical protein [Inhella sp.]|uniref:hypothetical protein n=1 Tax=Inhella sp. TaxID=1921806 RepID=UPI0035B253FA